MIRALLGKELRQLAPLVAVMIGLLLYHCFNVLVVSSPDEYSWAFLSKLLTPGSLGPVGDLYFVLAIIATYMLLPREHDQRTIEFLYALPVHRLVVFFTKVLAVLLVLLISELAGYGLDWWLHQQHPNSIARQQLTFRGWALELALMCGFIVICVGYGMLISFFRRFGLMAVILLWFQLEFMEIVSPAFRYVDPNSLLQLEFRGTEMIVPVVAWIVHGVLAALSLLAAAVLWTRRAEALTTLNEKFSNSRASRIINVIAVGIAVLLVVALAFVIIQQQVENNSRQTSATGSAARLETDHYAFSYRPPDREHVLELASQADTDYLSLGQILNVPPGAVIAADLTGGSANHLGIAGWSSIKVNRSVLDDPIMRRHVLNHETVHVLVEAATDRKLDQLDAGFFVEGIAEWAAYHHQGPARRSARDALRLGAAAAWERFELRFDDLMDYGGFISQYDETLVYGIGEAWVTTLAEHCDITAVLSAIANSPKALSGEVFWQDSLQAARCDLSTVNGRFELMMAELAKQTAHIPRVRGGIASTDSYTVTINVAVIDGSPDTTYRVLARLRDGPSAPPTQITTASSRAQGGLTTSIALSAWALQGNRFQYQVGVDFDAEGRPFFERWQWADR